MYKTLNIQPEFYKKFYLTTPDGEKALRASLDKHPEQLLACKRRVAELDSFLKNGENRCHASRDQRIFLRRVLSAY
jgi:hypothetical protein